MTNDTDARLGQKRILSNALIVNEGEMYDGYVVIRDEMIEAVGRGPLPDSLAAEAAEVTDLKGAMLMPGVIDTHVHFRDPGLTRKADMASESSAALRGGVTSFIDMPNTIPPTISIEAWSDKMDLAASKSLANYAFFIGATNSNIEQLLEADYTHVPGVKLFLGSSTGNMLVDSESMLEKLFGGVDALIAVHAESESVIAANRKKIAEEYAGKDVPLEMHRVIRSRQACVEASRHAVTLAMRHNARLHLLHLSTAEEIGLIPSGPMEERRITAETCPHYLWFDSSDYARLGSRIKCNPAIKESSDRRALLRAVADGRIDTIATDSAPHQLADKEGDALHAASGMPGVQFSLPIMLELAERGEFTVPTVVERMCHAPAELYRIDRRGFIRPGYYADLVVVRPHAVPHTVSDTDAASICGWTPYIGAALSNRIESTYINGKKVFDGSTVDTSCRVSRPLRFNNQVEK